MSWYKDKTIEHERKLESLKIKIDSMFLKILKLEDKIERVEQGDKTPAEKIDTIVTMLNDIRYLVKDMDKES